LFLAPSEPKEPRYALSFCFKATALKARTHRVTEHVL